MKTKLITGLAVVLLLAFGSTAHAGEWKSGKIAGFNKAWLYVPSSYAPRPAGANKRALVVHMMGCGQVIDQVKTSSGWEQAAEAYGMYVLVPAPNVPVFPNKQGPKVECFNYGYDTSGNYGAAVPTPNSPDHKTLIAAPGLLRQQYPDIDPDQVYVTGLSAGAAMAYQAACMAPDVFHGVGTAAGPGLNSRQAQAVAPLNGAGMVAAQPTQAAMQTQCTSWIGSKTTDFRNQIWATVSDNNFLPVGNMASVGGVYTFDLFNDGSIWDGDKFAPTEYATRTVGMLKAILLNNTFTEEKLTLTESTEATRGSGCGDQAASLTFTGATAGSAAEAAPAKCMPLNAQRRHWKAEASHLRSATGHIQVSRIQQDTLKHSWPVGVDNTANWLNCIGVHQGYEITMTQIASPDHENYSVLKDPATGLWKADVVAQLDNGAIGCIYFNSYSVNFPMYLAELWNNNNPKLGAAMGNNKKPKVVGDVSVSGYAVTVSGTATDEDGTVSSVVITLKNQATGTSYGPITASMNGTGYFTHTFSGLADGRHEAKVVATDDEGEATEFVQGLAVGDIPNNKPVINTFTATSTEKGCITFAGTTSDSDGSVTAVTISIIGQSAVAATVSGANFNAKVCDLPQGRTYSGAAVATDDLGAKSDEKSFSVLVPASTECESVTGYVANDLENRTDLVESYVCYAVLTCYRTTGDQQTITKNGGPEYTIFIGNDGKGYLTDPQDCATQVTLFTVTATVSGTGGTVTPATQQVGENETAAILVTPASGKKIDTVTGCNGTLSGTTYTTGPVTANCTVTATFADEQVNPTNYTVTLTAGANGSISPSGAQTVQEGNALTFTVNPAANYNVKTVSGCGATQVSGNNYTTAAVTQNCTVTATFEAAAPVNYTVTLTAGANGTVSPSGLQVVASGNSLAFTANPASGYAVKTVSGCGAYKVSGNSYSTAAVTSNCSVSVTFEATATYYNVMLTAGANGTISPSGVQSVLQGGTVNFAVMPASGYQVKTVSGCGATSTGANSYVTGAISADCTVTATFEAAVSTVNVTLTAGANGSISPAGVQSVVKGNTLDFAVNPASGYQVNTVSGCGATQVSGNNYRTAAVNSACTVSATFKAVVNSHNVTLTAASNGSISPSGVQSVADGDSLSFTVAPASGYVIKAVTGCGATKVSGNQYTTAAITGACTVSATFEAATSWKTVTLVAGANGTVSPSGAQSVLEGSSLNFSVSPDTGYRINTVTGCQASQTGASTYTTGTITADCTVTVTFELKTVDPVYHSVTLTAGANGQISPAGLQQVIDGNALSVNVVPATGYRILNVSGCGVTAAGPVGTYITAPISGDCDVVATFEQITYVVTASAGTGGTITPKLVTAVVPGTVLSFDVVADNNYVIKAVSGCGETYTAPADTTSVTYQTAAIEGACSVTASFALKINIPITSGSGSMSPALLLMLVPGLVLLRARRRRHAA